MKSLCGSLLLSAFVLLLPGPPLTAAEPSSSQIGISLATKPDRPSVGEETQFVITLKDQGQQPVQNASVSITAEKAHSQGSAGHAGMSAGQPMVSRLTAAAKPTGTKGEYEASLKLTEEGDWTVVVTGGNARAQFNTVAVKPGASPGKSAVASPSSVSAEKGTSIAPAPKEVVHASYLDLSTNISDLRTRIGQWQKGDADSLKIAEEKLERIEVILKSVGWPREMSAAITKTRSAIDPMAQALKAKDVNAAQAAMQGMGDGSHDVTHAFYGDWLPSLKDTTFSIMAPHAIYLDITANINDLRTRVDQWIAGDEGSLNIAKEKVERIGVLLPHMYSTGMFLKRIQAMEKALPPVLEALEKKDSAAAQRALKPVADGSHDLTHDFYPWMNVTASASNPACIQASYLDLTANLSDLRARIGLWQKGDEGSLNIAREKLERIEAVLAHPLWPGAMAAAIRKTEAAVEPMAKALEAKDSAAAQTVAATLGDASHDVIHAYYGDYLPAAKLDTAGNQISGVQGGEGLSLSFDSHGHASDTALPNYWFVGSLLGMVLLTIALVPILKRRDAKMQPVEVN